MDVGRHAQAGDLRVQEGALSAVSGETGWLWGWDLVQTEVPGLRLTFSGR